jgi:single-stranded DNA-binding protein
MIAALVTGTLFRNPESRQSKNGNPFVSAILKEKDGDKVQFVRVAAFSESARGELARLSDGDALSVQGPLKAEVYESNGEHRISLSIVADAILPLRREHRAKGESSKPQDACSRQERQRGIWRDENDGPDDSLDGVEAI